MSVRSELNSSDDFDGLERCVSVSGYLSLKALLRSPSNDRRPQLATPPKRRKS